MNIQPLYDRILVQVIEEEYTSASGIVLTQEKNQKATTGKVLAVGSGHRSKDHQHLTPLQVAVNDIVIFSQYASIEISHQPASNLVIIREDDVLAIKK
jgi:chaperonin GroES